MKHAVKGRQLNRDISNRRALFKNLMLEMVKYGHIKTTEAKAKAIQSSFEKLITKAKIGTVHNRRLIDQVLNRRDAVNKMVMEIAPKITRTSGYTRIIKLGHRRGDDAEIVKLELIDWQPAAAPEKVKKVAKNASKAKVKPEEESKSVVPTAMIEDKAVSKIKMPAVSSRGTKHIPQKHGGGGK